MSLYPIYIDSSVAGAQLSIGTVNSSKIVIGPVSQDGTANISTVVNGVRIDSHKTNNNLLVSFGNNKYQVTSSDTLTNQCNTAVSNWAFGINNMTGNYCTAVGHNSLPRNTTAEYNTAIGSDTLKSITTGGFNTALGGRALNLTTNSSNVGIGYNTLASSITLVHPCVAVGTNALQNYNQTNGGGNTAIGYNALAGLTTGLGNVAIGYVAENNPTIGIKTSGGDNVVIGTDAGSRNNNRCIVLGHGASASGDDQIVLGKSDGAHTTYIQGSGGLNVTGPATFANTTINALTNGKAGQIILNKTIYNNNTTAYDVTNGVIDVITSATDTFDINGNNSTAKAIQLQGANLNFTSAVPTSTDWNRTGNGGNLLIRAGGAFSFGNNGTATQTLNGGNIYIDSGTAACGGGAGSVVTANPGNIYLRCGRKSSGTTYYSSAYDDKMTITPTDITTTVPMKIYEAFGSGTITGNGTAAVDSMSATVGSLIIKHGNKGGGSSIVFPNGNNNSDYGYIRYRDDANNAAGDNNRTRFEIGIENVTPGINSNDHLVLNKNGGSVGIGITDPGYTLDVSGTARMTSNIKCNIYDTNDTSAELQIGPSVTAGTPAVIRIGENITTGTVVIGNGNGQNGTISIGGSGSLARTITIGSAAAAAISPINLNGNVTLIRPLTLPTTYVAPVSGQLGYKATITLSGTTATGGTANLGGNPTNLVTFTMPIGVYILEATAQINTATVTYDWVFSPTSGIVGNTAGGYAGATGGTQRTTFVVSNSTEATWYWGARANVGSVAYAFMSLFLTRIA